LRQDRKIHTRLSVPLLRHLVLRKVRRETLRKDAPAILGGRKQVMERFYVVNEIGEIFDGPFQSEAAALECAQPYPGLTIRKELYLGSADAAIQPRHRSRRGEAYEKI
jgi:hypothetical protein